MLTVKEIKKILDENNIKYHSYGDKEYYAGKLIEHGLEPEKISTSGDLIKQEKAPNPKYDRLKTIMKNPRKVILEDIQTGEIREFPSIYKAGKFINRCPQTILNWEGRVWRNKYKINVL